MPLPKPNLDPSKFSELVEEMMNLIPRPAPEWTDHNISDPGYVQTNSNNSLKMIPIRLLGIGIGLWVLWSVITFPSRCDAIYGSGSCDLGPGAYIIAIAASGAIVVFIGMILRDMFS